MTASRSRPGTAEPRRTARLFINGASQAVRLPKEFRMEGSEVRIWKDGNRVVLEPIAPRAESLADVIERFHAACPGGLQIERNQPPMPQRDWSAFEPAPAPYKAGAAAKGGKRRRGE